MERWSAVCGVGETADAVFLGFGNVPARQFRIPAIGGGGDGRVVASGFEHIGRFHDPLLVRISSARGFIRRSVASTASTMVSSRASSPRENPSPRRAARPQWPRACPVVVRDRRSDHVHRVARTPRNDPDSFGGVVGVADSGDHRSVTTAVRFNTTQYWSPIRQFEPLVEYAS